MRRISCLFAPILGHAFFKQPQLKRLLGDDFLQFDSLTFEVFDFAGGGRSGGVACEAAFASFEELFRPAIVEAFGDAFTATELGNGRLTA